MCHEIRAQYIFHRQDRVNDGKGVPRRPVSYQGEAHYVAIDSFKVNFASSAQMWYGNIEKFRLAIRMWFGE